MIRLVYIILIFCCNIYANPAPLGFELNKATIFDVQKLYSLTKKEKNYWDGYNYYLDVRDIKLDGITKLLVICNDNNIIQAIILTINNNKFADFFQLLSEKYTIIDKDSSKKNKYIKFVNGNSAIILDAPHINCEMSLIYITNEFLAKFQDKQKEEQFITRMSDKELL